MTTTCPAGGPRTLEAGPPVPDRWLRRRPERLLERALALHPALTCAGALLLTGAGMLTAVCLVTAAAVLPLSILLGLI